MLEYLWAGGPVMIPIALCSIVALAAFFERLVALRRGRVAPRGFVVKIVELLRQGRIDDALIACRKSESAIARILEVAVMVRGGPRADIKERLEEIGRREAADLERFIPIVGTIAAVSPLLGLLGTVGGMIATFAVIQDQGLGDVDRLAGGISQALITTFAGLCVGIPALIANRYLLGRSTAWPWSWRTPAFRCSISSLTRPSSSPRRLGEVLRLATTDPLVDLTPMIDIVFQLVLFFMVSTTFVSSPGIQVDLPRSSQDIVAVEKDDVNIWMTLEGAVYLNEKPVTLEELQGALERVARKDTNTLIIIKADTGVEHGRVVTVMDIARAKGLTRLAIATEAGGTFEEEP